MSFTLLSTANTTSSPLRQNYNHPGKRVMRQNGICVRNPRLVYTSCKLQQSKEVKDHGMIDRRNVLVGLGALCGAAASVLNQGTIANAGYATDGSNPVANYEESPMQHVGEFGSQPRALNKPIRALVERPKMIEDVEILIVEGIEIPNDGPVRFDVYIAKPEGDLVDPDYGELVGSLVDLGQTRVGRNKPKGSLDLGITEMVEDMEAEDSDKLVVTMVPRTGEVIIGGVRIETQ